MKPGLLTILYPFALIFCLLPQLNAQLAKDKTPSQALPAIFQIGEFEDQFEALSFEYETSLLSACDDNMDLAFTKWQSLLKAMEEFGDLNGVDLKGVKMWINVFWDENGKIDHIAYFLKPQSKNVEQKYISALFLEFSKTYQMPLTYPGKFSHHGIASFPVFLSRKSSC